MGLKMFSMFSGIGGFELSLEELGVECIGFSEIDRYAIAVFNDHFHCPNHGDASNMKISHIPNFDLLCAGFPCQDFSISGKRKGLRDKGEKTRSGLFEEIIRVIEGKKPKYILLENVKGMLNLKNSDDGNYAFDEMILSLNKLGYIVDYEVLNSKYFNLAQNRERVFIFAEKRKEQQKIKSYNPIKQRQINKGIKLFDSFLHHIYLNQFKREITSLKEMMQRGVSRRYWVNKKIKIKKEIKNNEDLKCVGIIYESIKPKGNYFPRERVFSNEGIARALTTIFLHHPMYQVKNKIRYLTPIETERLQGFPDDWTKQGLEGRKKINIPELERYKLTGNAVSVPIIKTIGEELLKCKK